MKQPYVGVIGIWGYKDNKRIRTKVPGVGQLPWWPPIQSAPYLEKKNIFIGSLLKRKEWGMLLLGNVLETVRSMGSDYLAA